MNITYDEKYRYINNNDYLGIIHGNRDVFNARIPKYISKNLNIDIEREIDSLISSRMVNIKLVFDVTLKYLLLYNINIEKDFKSEPKNVFDFFYRKIRVINKNKYQSVKKILENINLIMNLLKDRNIEYDSLDIEHIKLNCEKYLIHRKMKIKNNRRTKRELENKKTKKINKI